MRRKNIPHDVPMTSTLVFRLHAGRPGLTLRDILRKARIEGVSPDLVPPGVQAFDDDNDTYVVDPASDIRVGLFDELAAYSRGAAVRVNDTVASRSAPSQSEPAPAPAPAPAQDTSSSQ